MVIITALFDIHSIFVLFVTTEERLKELIVIKGTQKSLGIEIVGGTRHNTTSNNPDFGIFVKKVIANNPAHKDGTMII